MKPTLLLLAVTVLGFLTTSRAVFGGDNWPQFRGPTGLGTTEEKDLPLKWGGPRRENVLWQSSLVGQGHASPVVWGDSVFVCTVRWPASVTVRREGHPRASRSLLPGCHREAAVGHPRPTRALAALRFSQRPRWRVCGSHPGHRR